jgi:hypothetical protein
MRRPSSNTLYSKDSRIGTGFSLGSAHASGLGSIMLGPSSISKEMILMFSLL